MPRMKYEANVLGPVDTAFLYVETPETPMNIGAVTIFDGRLDYHQLMRLLDSRLHQAPIYRQKLIQPPMHLGEPAWAFDPDFYIENHVFQLTIDPPGTDEQLRELVSKRVSSMLDRNKPLWEAYLIDGLAEDRSAIFIKVHHCMVDGLSAVELFALMFDFTPEEPTIQDKPLYDPSPLPTVSENFFDSVSRGLAYKWNLLNKLGDDVAYLGSVLLDKERRRKTLVGLANIVNDNLSPLRKLAINGKNSGSQQLAWVEFSLAEVRAIKQTRHASVNDVMLAVFARAIERYSTQHDPDNTQDFLRVLVPVNMRVGDEKDDFGNRISVMPVDITFGFDDPLDRLENIVTYTHMMKESSMAHTLDMILTLPAIAPSWSQPLIWGAAPAAFSRVAHTWCTNVAGPQIPVYLLGHKMLHSYGFFPLNPSMGLACVIMSYNQRITMNLIADDQIVTDVLTLRRYLNEAYAELREAAKVQPMEPIQLDRVKAAGEPTVNPAPTEVPQTPPADSADNLTTPQPESDQQPDTEDENTEPSGDDPINTSRFDPLLNGATPTLPDKAEPKPHEQDTATSTPEVDLTSDEPAKPSDKPEEETGPPKIFSERWAQAYQESINNSRAYYQASTRWTAGALAMVMKASPRNGYPTDSAILLDLHQGICRNAHSLRPAEAPGQASFVIEGDYQSWMKVLRGEAQPLGMIMRGKLRLTKGSLPALLPYTQSAQELIRCAQTIS